MDKVIIFGVNMFSAVVLQSILREKKAEVLGFTLNKEYITSDSFEGLPVIPFEDLDSHFDMKDVKIAITVGYSRMNENRAIVYSKCKAKGYNIYTFISDSAYVMATEIGEGSIILPQAFVGSGVTIGQCVIIWPLAYIGYHNGIGDFSYVSSRATTGGGTIIGSHCFLGLSCIVLNNLSIGDKTLIGAGCVMRRNTETNNSVFVGNPAICLKSSADEIITKVK